MQTFSVALCIPDAAKTKWKRQTECRWVMQPLKIDFSLICLEIHQVTIPVDVDTGKPLVVDVCRAIRQAFGDLLNFDVHGKDEVLSTLTGPRIKDGDNYEWKQRQLYFCAGDVRLSLSQNNYMPALIKY